MFFTMKSCLGSSHQNSFSVNYPAMASKGRKSINCKIRFCKFLLCGLTEFF